MGSDSVSDEAPERRFRTLFISDVHLGARGSQADRLLDFLRSHDADTIYLVGDIVDGGALKSSCTGRNRTTTSCRRCCARRARAPRSSTCRAITTSSCVIITARISAASTWWKTPFMK